MADVNEMLSGILSNPQAMESIMAMAKSLGQQSTPPQQQSTQSPADPMQLMQSLLQLSRNAGGDERQVALFQALKPFIRPERAERLDRAMQVARISRLAGNALHVLGPQFFQAGERHV